MFKKLSAEDFAALRGPFESGRQSPKHLGDMLFLSIFLQGLMYALEYFVIADASIYPNKGKILTIHFWITLIIYSIPAVYKKSQKIQYLVVILVSQNLLYNDFVYFRLSKIWYPFFKRYSFKFHLYNTINWFSDFYCHFYSFLHFAYKRPL